MKPISTPSNEFIMKNWLLYGANGYTGRLIIEEALSRGHRPVLAGRSESKIAPLAQRYGLDYRCFDLKSQKDICEALHGIDLVFHAAGPFVRTAEPMIRACLETRAHYVDITGEIPVFANTFNYNELARERGVCLMSGVGFDVVPTDCLGAFVAQRLPDANQLEIAFSSSGGASAGTSKTMVEMLGKGGFIRENGKLKSFPLGKGFRQVTFSNGKTIPAMPIPWGDLETAFHSTGIPNITTLMTVPKLAGKRGLLLVMQNLLRVKPLVWGIQKLIGLLMDGPDENKPGVPNAQIWARATNPKNEVAEAWLEVVPGYPFTARAGVLCTEKILESQLAGAFTPSMAFGADLVLEIEGSKRFESLKTGVIV